MMGPPIIHAQPAKPSSDTDKLDSVMKSQTNEHLRSSTFSPLRAILYLLNGFVNDIKSKNRPKAVLLENVATHKPDSVLPDAYGASFAGQPINRILYHPNLLMPIFPNQVALTYGINIPHKPTRATPRAVDYFQ